MNTRFQEVVLATPNFCIQEVCGEEGVDNVFVNVHLGLTRLVHSATLIYGFSLAL